VIQAEPLQMRLPTVQPLKKLINLIMQKDKYKYLQIFQVNLERMGSYTSYCT